jgi:ATP-dependent Clp protease ATP-binding subunit ClpC
MTDGRGKRVYLSDAVIIMTSNLGAENFRKLTSPMGFLKKTVGVAQVEGEVMRELERRFPPEFRNRIDEVVLFSPLTHDEVREIARHYLQQVTLTLAKSGKTIRVEDEALELVVTKGYSMAFGARFLKRFIDEHIKLPISAKWKNGSHFDVTLKDGELVVEPGITKVTSADEAMAYGDVA